MKEERNTRGAPFHSISSSFFLLLKHITLHLSFATFLSFLPRSVAPHTRPTHTSATCDPSVRRRAQRTTRSMTNHKMLPSSSPPPHLTGYIVFHNFSPPFPHAQTIGTTIVLSLSPPPIPIFLPPLVSRGNARWSILFTPTHSHNTTQHTNQRKKGNSQTDKTPPPPHKTNAVVRIPVPAHTRTHTTQHTYRYSPRNLFLYPF